jgi:hypothetical protein
MVSGMNPSEPTGNGRGETCKLLWDGPWCPVLRCDPYRQGRRGGLRLGVDRREEDEDFICRFKKYIYK